MSITAFLQNTRTSAVLGRLVVGAVVASTLTGVALPSTASAATADAPPAPTNLQATANLDEVKLTWDQGVGTIVTTVRGKAGAVAPSGPEDGFPVGLDASVLPSATASDLDPSQPYTFAVFDCSATNECSAPAVVTVGSTTVKSSVSPDRITYGREVQITGTVVDTLTGAPLDGALLRLIAHPIAAEDAFVIAEDSSAAGGRFTFPVSPPEQAEFAVVAMGDAAHLGGFGLTRTVSVAAAVLIEPVTKKGPLGTTFQFISGAVPTPPSVPLVLQEKVGKKWKTVLKKKPNRKGLATLRVKPTTKGKHVYRVMVGKSPGVGPGTSRQVAIKVT